MFRAIKRETCRSQVARLLTSCFNVMNTEIRQTSKPRLCRLQSIYQNVDDTTGRGNCAKQCGGNVLTGSLTAGRKSSAKCSVPNTDCVCVAFLHAPLNLNDYPFCKEDYAVEFSTDFCLSAGGSGSSSGCLRGGHSAEAAADAIPQIQIHRFMVRCLWNTIKNLTLLNNIC